MHPAVIAQRAVRRHGECCPLGAASVTRFFFHTTLAHDPMRIAPRIEHEQPVALRRVAARPSVDAARSWTGRASVAWATDSRLPRLVTAGTRVTRVSAVRTYSARADRLARRMAVAAGHVALQRRREPVPLIASG